MESNKADTLEGFISVAISQQFKNTPPTEDEFNDWAEKVRQANSSIFPVSDNEFQNLKKRLRETVTVTMDTGICLPDPQSGHQSWLPARRADIDFYYWNRYKKYLQIEKHWNPRVISKLGQVSDEMLDQCGDPAAESFHIRGLMLGDVQSGKTASYTALANMAADAGYELIIILAGTVELLRRQTQKRLDREFCGRQSNLYLDPKAPANAKYVPVGVGRYGARKKIACFTSEANDFSADVLRSNGLSLDSVSSTILLTVKKNKTILNNLSTWLKQNNSLNREGRISKSLLLIDDEADNASVNTKAPDSDPTAVNNAIRRLLSLFSKTTYLAVTATPFANIFIDPSISDDLFPADFIYALDAPTNYIGAERIFSDGGDRKNLLEEIDVSKFLEIFPDKHKKDLVIQNLPQDMYEAAYYFLLANAVRDLRGDNTEHRSMMIHVSRFVAVQKQISEILNTWLDQVKSDIGNYAALPEKDSDRISNIHELHSVWNKYDFADVSGTSWNDILKNYLYRAVAPIDVRSVNSITGASSLDYDSHDEDGLRVIAVGGNILSRGMTLEGLMTSYFYRNTNMYDTLMQMGRWFGYRPNYEDLVKIWLSADAIDWYGQINEAAQDLRTQIYKMKESGLSPRAFGLKVRQDPGSLIVTARNKMRTATTITCPVSVSGHLLETPRLFASNKILAENAELVEKFIDRLSREGVRVSESEFRSHGNYFWKNVSGDCVSELLGGFQTHPWHMSYNGKALSEYVATHAWKDGWDVVLIKNGEGKAFSREIRCGSEMLAVPFTERRKIAVSNDILSVSGSKLRVGVGGCARIGLEQEEIYEAKKIYFSIYSGKRIRPNLPDSAYLISGRKPILMIHIINAQYDKMNMGKYPEFLYALGVGFPADDHGNETAIYKINLVELKNWMPPEEETEE